MISAIKISTKLYQSNFTNKSYNNKSSYHRQKFISKVQLCESLKKWAFVDCFKVNYSLLESAQYWIMDIATKNVRVCEC